MSLSLKLLSGKSSDIVSSTKTDDGSVVSVVFGAFRVRSDLHDRLAMPDAKTWNCSFETTGDGAAWVRVELNGFRATEGQHSWSLGYLWANGHRIAVCDVSTPTTAPNSANPCYAATRVYLTPGQTLAVSISLLAQRDLREPDSQAELSIDTLDVSVV